MFYGHPARMYNGHSTCMYYGNRTCRYFGQSTCVLYGHRACMYNSHSTCGTHGNWTCMFDGHNTRSYYSHNTCTMAILHACIMAMRPQDMMHCSNACSNYTHITCTCYNCSKHKCSVKFWIFETHFLHKPSRPTVNRTLSRTHFISNNICRATTCFCWRSADLGTVVKKCAACDDRSSNRGCVRGSFQAYARASARASERSSDRAIARSSYRAGARAFDMKIFMARPRVSTIKAHWNKAIVSCDHVYNLINVCITTTSFLSLAWNGKSNFVWTQHLIKKLDRLKKNSVPARFSHSA